MGMREKAGEISLCGNVRGKRAKCGSLRPNAGGLATMWKSGDKIQNNFKVETLQKVKDEQKSRDPASETECQNV